jgi:hypothetical protein
MENSKHDPAPGAKRAFTASARPNRSAPLPRFRRFLARVWSMDAHRQRPTHDCARCGERVIEGLYCFNCGYVRPRQPRTPPRRDRNVTDWLFRAR